MLGALGGDLLFNKHRNGSRPSGNGPARYHTSPFSGNAVVTIAIADSIMNKTDYAESLKKYYRAHPEAGYGLYFTMWASSNGSDPYRSWGCGSAVRAVPVGFAFKSINKVLEQAEQSAAVTHNHPQAVRGAQAVAAAVFMARQGQNRHTIKEYVTNAFGYDLSAKLQDLGPQPEDISCGGTVPPALIAALESATYEEAVQNAIELAGPGTSIACIAGGLAQAVYKQVPESVKAMVYHALDEDLETVAQEFAERFSC